MSRNVGQKAPLYVAQNPKRVKISITPRKKPEINYVIKKLVRAISGAGEGWRSVGPIM
jgi:hypothetical protein